MTQPVTLEIDHRAAAVRLLGLVDGMKYTGAACQAMATAALAHATLAAIPEVIAAEILDDQLTAAELTAAVDEPPAPSRTRRRGTGDGGTT